jgi:hypothetical protein
MSPTLADAGLTCQPDRRFRRKIRFDIAHRTGDVFVLLSHRRDVVNGSLCRIDSRKPGNNPDGEILRSEATARSRDIAFGKEGLIEHRNAGFFDPRFGGQIGTCRDSIEKPQLCKDECSRTLRTQELSSRIEFYIRHDRPIFDDLPGE